jgi:phosphate transport system substrate-binding protein
VTRMPWLWHAVLGAMVSVGMPAGASLAAGGPARPLVFAGSGTNLAITRLLATAYEQANPGTPIEIPSSLGSTGAIRAVQDGAITVALISRALRASEQGSGLAVVPYARTPLLFGAHPSVPDTGLSGDELIQIVAGTKSRWRDGREMVVLLLYPGDSLTEEILRKIPGLERPYAASYAAKRWTFLYSDALMNDRLAKTPASLGVTTLGAILTDRLAIKPLAFNGMAPTLDNLQAGRYPLSLTLAFAFIPAALPPPANAFLAFVRSAPAEALLRRHGYLAVR